MPTPAEPAGEDPSRMSRAERRAGASLAAIFALRMLGLFLVLPVFALHATELPGGDDLTLVGLALGAYGLTQAFLQIPFGIASDHLGRKRVIVFGLLLFVAGSVLAALAPNIQIMIFARVLQGAGAISAAVTALAADLTREAHRTKVMAMIGSSIGLVFALSLVVAPTLYSLVGLSGIFWITAGLALGSIALLAKAVPVEPPRPALARKTRFATVLLDPQLMRMNLGVFALHLMQIAMWVVMPAALVAAGGLVAAEHWKVYLPAVLASFVVMVPAIILAEKHGKMRSIFLAAVALLIVVQLGLWQLGHSVGWLALWLTLFFVSFNVLEATLPSLISRMVPGDAKGAALGVYNTTQSVGLFVGGALGGMLAKQGGPTLVHAFCAAVACLWLVVALTMSFPRARPAAVSVQTTH